MAQTAPGPSAETRMTPIPKPLLRARIDDWQARGLLEAETAERLQADLEARRAGGGFRRFVILAGILCLAFAAISFVAANWEAMPRPARLALILATLWTTWGAGLWAARAGRAWLAEGLFLLASAVFGGGLALVAQLYHIQGSAPGFVLVWSLGTLAAAGLVRARLVLALGIVLIATWHGLTLDIFGPGDADPNLPFLALWAIAAALAVWTGGRLAPVLLAIALGFWWISAVAALVPRGAELPVVLFSALGCLALALFALGPRRTEATARTLLPFAALALLALALIAYFDRSHSTGWQTTAGAVAAVFTLLIAGLTLLSRTRAPAQTYDLAVATLAAVLGAVAVIVVPLALPQAAYGLALAIWIARMGWRIESLPVRVIGMGGFLVGLLTIYGETLGSLIGTAGFYLGAGLVLLAGAWLSTRLHRTGEGAS